MTKAGFAHKVTIARGKLYEHGTPYLRRPVHDWLTDMTFGRWSIRTNLANQPTMTFELRIDAQTFEIFWA